MKQKVSSCGTNVVLYQSGVYYASVIIFNKAPIYTVDCVENKQ